MDCRQAVGDADIQTKEDRHSRSIVLHSEVYGLQKMDCDRERYGL
jgi:hypothetical protein